MIPIPLELLPPRAVAAIVATVAALRALHQASHLVAAHQARAHLLAPKTTLRAKRQGNPLATVAATLVLQVIALQTPLRRLVHSKNINVEGGLKKDLLIRAILPTLVPLGALIPIRLE